MTVFDPQGLYIHHQKSTKRGQIIQKRPIYYDGATSPREIPRALAVLTNNGYTAFPSTIWDKRIVNFGTGNVTKFIEPNKTIRYTLQEFYNTFPNNVKEQIRDAYNYGLSSCDIHIDYYSIYSYAEITNSQHTDYQLTLPSAVLSPEDTLNQNMYTSTTVGEIAYIGFKTGANNRTVQTIPKADSAVGISDYDNYTFSLLEQLIRGTSTFAMYQILTNGTGTGVTLNMPMGLTITLTLQ